MLEKEIQKYCPKNQQEWREWLAKNHKSVNSIWLVFYRTKSSKHNLTWSEAVDQALCYGWIDSTKRTIDHESYIQYFCPRKPNSNWSKINKDKVKVLEEKGLMTKAGRDSIEIAKENGSWTILDSIEAMIIPEDLEHEFQKSSGSMDYFLTLSKTIKKGILYWVKSAKRPETRSKRIKEVAEKISIQTVPKQFK